MRLSAEEHRAEHQRLHQGLVLLAGLYSLGKGQSLATTTVWDVLENRPRWWPQFGKHLAATERDILEEAWHAFDATLGCYFWEVWTGKPMTIATQGMFCSTTLAELLQWSTRMCTEAAATEQDEEDV